MVAYYYWTYVEPYSYNYLTSGITCKNFVPDWGLLYIRHSNLLLHCLEFGRQTKNSFAPFTTITKISNQTYSRRFVKVQLNNGERVCLSNKAL